MKFSHLLLGVLSLSTLTSGRLQRRRFRPKTHRGTRHPPIDPRHIAYNQRRSSPQWSNSPTACVECVTASSASILSSKENIWIGLTNEEASTVAAFLFEHSGFNLVMADNATDWDNTLALVELLQPNKTDALAYLDGTSPPPARYAHAVLDIRSVDEAYMQDFVVGPLPVVMGVTTIEPLNYPYNKGKGIARNYNADEDSRAKFLVEVGKNISDITMGLWGVKMTGAEDDPLSIWGIDPLWQEDGRIISWEQFWGVPTGEFASYSLLPMGLYFKTDVTGRDVSKWSVKGVFYNGIFYETLDDFRAAYNTPGFEKLGGNIDGNWTHTDQEGAIIKGDELYPPIHVAPEGGRFGLDQEKQYVEWMDFSFYIAFTRDSGVRLYDIKYKGDRVIYELGLQEALAHYAGNDPTQSGTSYLDSFYGIGTWAFELLPGFDCPSYATFLNTSQWMDETHRINPNSICLFEQDAGYPLARHTSLTYAASTKNIFFTLRNICTVGNYDYMFSYSFYMDGSIHVDVRASGYIQSAYFAKNSEYGYKIHDNLSGSVHDHVLNFKVDLDILGTSNTVATSEFIPTEEKYSWSGGRSRKTFKLKKGWITNEDEGKINWHPNGAKTYAVVNKEQKNKYGEYRGYKIVPSTVGVHATAVESSNLNDAATWSHYHLYVTKRKDTEPHSFHAYNSIDTLNPVVNFDKFFDSESLEQEDLVLWVNLGMHHAPHTGDLPNTVFSGAHAGVAIEPLNYLLGSPVKQTKHMARVSFGGDAGTVADKFGVQAPTCPFSAKGLEIDLGGYSGTVVVRKFPYDTRDGGR